MSWRKSQRHKIPKTKRLALKATRSLRAWIVESRVHLATYPGTWSIKMSIQRQIARRSHRVLSPRAEMPGPGPMPARLIHLKSANISPGTRKLRNEVYRQTSELSLRILDRRGSCSVSFSTPTCAPTRYRFLIPEKLSLSVKKELATQSLHLIERRNSRINME